MRRCQRRILLYHSRTLVQNGHPVLSRAVPLLRLCHNFLQTQVDRSGTPADRQTFKVHVSVASRTSELNQKIGKEESEVFHQPFLPSPWCIFVSSSSFLNCAFERSKSKSVSNLRVAEGTVATMSWPCLRLLRLRAPKIMPCYDY